MKHPRYVSQVCANVLFALGVIFLVLEVLLPRDVVLVYTGAGNLTLWLGGLVLILAGAGFALKAWRRYRRDKALLAQGSAVPGTVLTPGAIPFCPGTPGPMSPAPGPAPPGVPPVSTRWTGRPIRSRPAFCGSARSRGAPSPSMWIPSVPTWPR